MRSCGGDFRRTLLACSTNTSAGYGFDYATSAVTYQNLLLSVRTSVCDCDYGGLSWKLTYKKRQWLPYEVVFLYALVPEIGYIAVREGVPRV